MQYKGTFDKHFGPIIYALGDASKKARYRVLWYGHTQPHCWLDDQPITPELHYSINDGGAFWVLDFFIEQATQSEEHKYKINDQCYTFLVPGTETHSLRTAFASCNGAASDSPFKPLPEGRYDLWQQMAVCHQRNPYHVLIQGGDQLYADGVWNDIPFLVKWQNLPRSEQYDVLLPDKVLEEIKRYYLISYMAYWSAPGIREVLASIPNVMIWDDHDIFDGWGSWNADYQACSVYQSIFTAAREAFYLFQRGQRPPTDKKTASIMLTLGHTAIVAPDLRSERTREQVMGDEGWAWMRETLSALGGDKTHLLLVSSVPLATSHFSALDPILTGFPSWIAQRLPKKINPKQFADDIHDQWRVPDHRDEWLLMLNTLLDYVDKTDTRITVLSGEIHLGGRSLISRKQSEIHQFISSGVAHPPASAFVVWCCEWLSKGVQDINDDIDIRIEYFLPEQRKKYLRARNWLSLEAHRDMRLSASWQAEYRAPIVFNAD